MIRAAAPSAAAWAVLAVALTLTVLSALESPWVDDLDREAARVGSDFQILHAAATGLAEGAEIHDPAVLDELGRRVGRPQTPFCAAQPLVLAVVGASVGGLSFEAAYLRWMRLQGLALVAAAVLLAGVLAGGGMSRPAALGAVLLVLGVGDATWMSLAMASTNALALAAIAGALLAATRGRAGLEGLALALAVVAKTSPAWLVVVAALAGRWRTVAWAAGWFGALQLGAIAWVGGAIHLSWIDQVLPALGFAPDLAPGLLDNGLHAWNLSPHGLLARAAARADLPRGVVVAGAWAVVVLVFLQLLQLRGAGGRDAPADREVVRRRLAEYALGIAGAWLVSSVTWPHHLVFLVVPWCWWALGWGEGRRGPLLLAGTLVSLVLLLPLGVFSPEDPEARIDITIRALLVVTLFGLLSADARGSHTT